MRRDNIAYADELITVSDSITTEYQRWYGMRKGHVVRNCPSQLEQTLPWSTRKPANYA